MEELERRIYKYFNGFDDVFVDPSEVDYRLMKSSESEDMATLDKWLELPQDEEGTLLEDKIDPKQMELFSEACHRLDPIIRSAFDVKPFDNKTGLGLIHEEVLHLYLDYIEWRLSVKKNID